MTSAPLTSGHVPCRNCGARFPPVRTRRCESWSWRNSFTIVAAAGVTVQSQSAWALEFLIRVSSAVKLVVVGAKMTLSVTVKP